MMQPHATRLLGTFTALVTPFTTDGSTIDTARLAERINDQAIAGVTGVVPCGTTGESPTLSDAEYRTVVETTIEHARPQGLTVIAGAGSNATNHAVELHRFAAAAGADAALHVTPYYNRPSADGLYRHFMTLADAADLPIVLYNVPGRTGVRLTTDTIERLAKHPNIIAVKDATGGLDQASEIIVRTDLHVLSGDDPLTLPLIAMGGSGVISVTANIRPADVATMVAAALADHMDDAREVHFDLLALSKALLRLGPNPTPIKAAMAMAGLDTGTVRLPLVDINDVAKAQLRALVETTHVDSMPTVEVTPSARPSVTPGVS
ncbi:MAG: 4-hydroxy-tetrahydrodipicolinate synthase [Planctomycetota bacterium]